MPTNTIPHLIEDRDRHGNVRRYVWKPRCKKIRIREEPGSAEFFLAYAEALKLSVPITREIDSVDVEGSLRWLCAQYIGRCAEYRQLSPGTRQTRKLILDRLCDMKDEKGRTYGSAKAALLRSTHIEDIRAAKADTPEAANSIIKALRMVFAWAKTKEYVASNVALDVKKLIPTSPDGIHAWTEHELETYEARHPIGTKARLALGLLLFVGVRSCDVVKLGRQMIGKQRDPQGRLLLHFNETKGSRRQSKPRVVPILPELEALIEATPNVGQLAFLSTEYQGGRPFSVKGFGNKFRDWCDQAGLPECSSHGLRKLGATRAAEDGATVYELMAMYGWKSIKQAEIYTRKADAKRLAASGMHRVAVRGSSAKAGG